MNNINDLFETSQFKEFIVNIINDNENYNILKYTVDDTLNFGYIELTLEVEYPEGKDLLNISVEYKEDKPIFQLIERTDLLIEEIMNDKLDFDISYWSYNITYDQLARLFNTNKIKIPDMQRGFVWDHIQASKLIESIFMGLPLPSIFLIKQSDNSYLIVDGLQRITTIGKFRYNKNLPNYPNHSGFKLKGVNSRINNKTYDSISSSYPELIDRFEMGTINIIEFKQNKPDFEESMYFLFERINSGGTSLSPQQIRNSISYGPFNEKLNSFSSKYISPFFSKKNQEKLTNSETILRTISVYNFIIENNINNLSPDNTLPEGVPKSIVYKTLLNKTAESYHLKYKKAERIWANTNSINTIDHENFYQEFLNSEDGINLSKDFDDIFEKLKIALQFIVEIFKENSFKRVEDKNFTSRSLPIMVESTIISVLLNIDKINDSKDSQTIINNYKVLVEKNYDNYFSQATGQTKNILGRIDTMNKVFFNE